MATLTLVIPDAAVPRIQAALGVVTKAEAEAFIKAWIKMQVRAYEGTLASNTAGSQVDQEAW